MVVLRELTLGGMQLGQLCPLSLHVLDELDLLVIAEPASACTRCLAMATRSGRRSSLSSLAMAGIAATCRGDLLPLLSRTGPYSLPDFLMSMLRRLTYETISETETLPMTAAAVSPVPYSSPWHRRAAPRRAPSG